LEFRVTDVQVVDFSGVEDYLRRVQGSGSGRDDFADPVGELLAMRRRISELPFPDELRQGRLDLAPSTGDQQQEA
jgi:hypothetical protein